MNVNKSYESDAELESAQQPISQGILDSLAENIALVDSDGAVVSVNKSWREFSLQNGPASFRAIGVDANRLEFAEAASGPFSDDARAALKGIRSVLEGAASSFSFEYPCHFESETRWFELHVTPWEVATARSAVLAHREITARKQTEIVLANERKILEKIAKGNGLSEILDDIARGIEAQAQGLRCSILLLDTDGLHLRHGSAPSLPIEYCKAVDGVTIGPRVGSCGTAAFHNKMVIVTDIAVDPLWSDFRELAIGHGLRACWSRPIPSPDGKVAGTFALYYHEPRRPSADELELIDRTTYVAGVAIDRARSAESLRQSNRSLRALVDVSPLAIVVLDRNANVTMWNPAAEKLFGWSETEVRGHQVPYIAPENREQYQSIIENGLNGKCHLGLEVIRQKKDGSKVELSLWSVPMRNERGDVVSLLGMLADDTERKSLEEQFRQAQKMEAVGRLAGGIAHDFNNLLTVIGGYVDILLDEIPLNDPKTELLEEIRKAGRRAAALTGHLLAFSRKQILEPKIVDLNAMVTHSQAMLARILGEDVKLIVVPALDLGSVKADPGQLDNVLMNLVVNARDAMPHGGKIIIQTENATIGPTDDDVPADVAPGPYVLLSVADSGFGMNEATKARIFEPFFTTKEPGKGTGLGLAMIHGFVKQSGGHVAVQSQPGSGTIVNVYLPAVSRASSVDEPEAVPKALAAMVPGRLC